MSSFEKFLRTKNKVINHLQRREHQTDALSMRLNRGTFVSLSQLFDQAEDILESIDKLMEGFKESDVEFYSGYKSARVIRDIGTRQKPEPTQTQTEGDQEENP